MHTCQHNLFGATGSASQRILDIEDHVGNRAAATFTSCNRGDAERALVVATILYLDEGARTTVQAGQQLA
jgi:hypothetical protein